MQIHRNDSQPLPLPNPALANEKPAATHTPEWVPDAKQAQPSGVTYTGSQDLKSMTLKDQLQYGRNMGVFTKISVRHEGALATAPRQEPLGSSAEGFVTSAVNTMKDFEDGLAALKMHSPDARTQSTDFLTARFRGLQNAAAKLNVFA
jgi:hypothetical protein